MKKSGILLLALFAASTASARLETLVDVKGSPYDVVAPTMPSAPTNPVQGQIYYDSANNSFKGINNTGTPVVLAAPGSGYPVTSESLERVERASITISGATCTIDSQSGAWLASTTGISTGKCNITYDPAAFSATPTCTISGPAGNYCATIAPTSTYAHIEQTACTTSAFIDAGGINVICMGPR